MEDPVKTFVKELSANGIDVDFMKETFIRNYPDNEPALHLKKAIIFFEHAQHLINHISG